MGMSTVNTRKKRRLWSLVVAFLVFDKELQKEQKDGLTYCEYSVVIVMLLVVYPIAEVKRD
jgi:hypothetical protein